MLAILFFSTGAKAEQVLMELPGCTGATRMGLENREFWSVWEAARGVWISTIGEECGACLTITEVTDSTIELHITSLGQLDSGWPEGTKMIKASVRSTLDRETHEAIATTVERKTCNVIQDGSGT